MPIMRLPADAVPPTQDMSKPPSVTETPEQYAMGPKPPPVNFDMIEDLGRTCASIKAMAELGASKCDEQTLRRLSRLVMLEREMRQIIHADILFKRGGLEEQKDEHSRGSESMLFPAYRSFHDARLIVQDLQAVWDGQKWAGDGACTLNKWSQGSHPTKWYDKDTICWPYATVWPQRLLIMHTSLDAYQVGERRMTGRSYIPPVQYFCFYGLKPGDYITGELYVEIC